MVISEDPWPSHKMPRVWQWSCHYLFFYDLGLSRLGFEHWTFHLRANSLIIFDIGPAILEENIFKSDKSIFRLLISSAFRKRQGPVPEPNWIPYIQECSVPSLVEIFILEDSSIHRILNVSEYFEKLYPALTFSQSNSTVKNTCPPLHIPCLWIKSLLEKNHQWAYKVITLSSTFFICFTIKL